MIIIKNENRGTRKSLKLKIIETDNTNPYVNLAAEEYLTMHAAEDVMTLFLWQNEPTVVIGKNQNPWRECRVEAMKRDGVHLARRISGGGAVYHDKGNLNFTFIARDSLYDTGRQTDVILRACRLLGIDASKNGRNDLTVDGRKFSGHAYYSSRGFNYHHGTIMLNVDPDALAKYLNVSDSKLKSKGVASVRSRVTNLIEYLPGNADPVSAMKAAMIKAASGEYGIEPDRDHQISQLEQLAVPQELISKYASEEWRYGTRIPFERELTHRFGWGEVQVQLAMKGGFISDCRIYSDALETEAFAAVEEKLIGSPYDAAAIRSLSTAGHESEPDDEHDAETIRSLSTGEDVSEPIRSLSTAKHAPEADDAHEAGMTLRPGGSGCAEELLKYISEAIQHER